jgi:hypothetical protein
MFSNYSFKKDFKLCHFDPCAISNFEKQVHADPKITERNELYANLNEVIHCLIQCPPLNRITLGRHKSDNNNRMIQLTDVFCALFIYKCAGHI